MNNISESSDDEDFDFGYLKEQGPKFRTLAEIYERTDDAPKQEMSVQMMRTCAGINQLVELHSFSAKNEIHYEVDGSVLF